MSGRPKGQRRQISNGTSENYEANSSPSVSNYNPIAMINKEINGEDCRQLLMKVDTMREILRMEKISLPQIVVVGDQSVGKSSILEAISSIELPRAQNICTRCPLELRMKSAPSDSPDYATIRCDGVDEMIIQDLSEIPVRVIQCTNFLTGDMINVSSKPIFLTVYKRDIQDDLTLVDLPGIVRTQIEGQSPTIYNDIVTLIKDCVKHESAVVLHVIPSSVDFSTSESIKICQEYDPRYERQMIAVSKIDKHDKGIAERLQGIGSGSLRLPLGCVAVLNRKQEEIDAGVSFEEMRRREAEFFRTNPAFTDVPQEYLGSQELIKKLVLIQQDRIRCTLPRVIEQVKEKIHTMREELKQIPSVILTETDTRIAFSEILRKYRRAVEQRVQGDYEIKSEKAGEKFDQHARGKWDDRIAYHLKMIGKCTSEEIKKILSKFTSEQHKPQVLQSIEENYGGGLPNFPSSNIIQQLYQPYHRELEKPCKDLVLWVEEYMIACLAYILRTVLPAQANYTLPLSHELIKIIKASVNKTTTASDNMGANDTLIGLQAYCSIVHARIVDHLSQLCEYWFIRNGVLVLDGELNTTLSPADLLKCMKELPILEQKRASLRRSIEAMERALVEAQK
ncbi:unnamed protein product [Adineta steineri]|uniref:Dynamin-type G domain-containing protein n=1 Tax=Adineta steineri TaxID=433720 RepID=A0A814JZ81_9BILA|nr:unnamed protein product [Adineta steineri]CAF1178973.1 unnamed protein product [Adineta steineri]